MYARIEYICVHWTVRPGRVSEDHAGREDERRTSHRVVVDRLDSRVVDVAVRAHLGRRHDAEVDGAAVQRLEVAVRLSPLPLLFRLHLGLGARLTPHLRARPALQRCTPAGQRAAPN